MQGYVILDPAFNACVLTNAPLELLSEGFRWLEGPVWFADHECLLFSDVPNNRIMRWTENGISVFRAPANFSNGQTRDMNGRLITCCHQSRSVIRTEIDGRITILADSYEGRRLNSPNDVVVKKSDGSIWFTDPLYGINTDYEGGKAESELPPRLYRLDPDGQLTIAADDLQGPNGLCFSPDETRLYVCETGVQFASAPHLQIRLYDVQTTKLLSNSREFHKVEPGYADGIRCDEDGNIWSSAGDGVHCISPDGALRGKILVPFTVANIAFGGRNRSRLFICAGQRLYAIYTNVRGAAWP
jgi:gluconolactonase